MAICDANYCFTLFDLGQYGSNNDSGVLANSEMGNMFDDNHLRVPADSKLCESEEQTLPYFLLGDEIFPLKKWLMRPYPGKNASEEERIYNYRHSRARRCIFNAFGVLSARWRIFHKPIRATVENVESYILACLALHNYLGLTDNAHYSLSGFTNSQDKDGKLLPGEWRLLKTNNVNNGGLVDLPRVRGCRSRQDALETRNQLKEFLNSEEGSLP